MRIDSSEIPTYSLEKIYSLSGGYRLTGDELILIGVVRDPMTSNITYGGTIENTTAIDSQVLGKVIKVNEMVENYLVDSATYNLTEIFNSIYTPPVI